MKQSVYLAGGFESDWRDMVVITTKNGYEFFVPQYRPTWRWSEYGAWDIHFIKKCDILFAYLGKENPSGYGLSAEVGYAKGINKTIILVIEPGHPKSSYFDFLRNFADVVFDNLEDGIKYLNEF